MVSALTDRTSAWPYRRPADLDAVFSGSREASFAINHLGRTVASRLRLETVAKYDIGSRIQTPSPCAASATAVGRPSQGLCSSGGVTGSRSHGIPKACQTALRMWCVEDNGASV